MVKIRRSGGGEPFEVTTVKLKKEPEGELGGFTDSSSDSFLLFDENLDCVGINPAGQELLDVSEDTVLGKNIVEIIPGTEEQETYEEYMNVIRTEERLVTNSMYGEKCLGIKAFKVGDGLGIIASDITERKLTEVTLHTTEQQWRSLFDSLEDASLIIDRDCSIDNINDNGLALLGKSKEEVIGEKCYQVICDREGTGEFCPLHMILETGKPQSMDRELFGRHFTVRVSPITDESGEIVKFIETMKDVSRPWQPDVARAKDGSPALTVDEVAMADLEGNLLGELGEDDAGALRRANEQLAWETVERKRVERELVLRDSAMQLSLSAIALADPEGNLTYVNRSFLKMWGYSEEKEVLGKPLTGFWGSKERALETTGALRALGGWEGELTARGKGGSRFEVELAASMVSDDDGQPICIVASLIDVTKRKQAEEELDKQQSRLDAREEEHETELKYVDERLRQEVGGRKLVEEQLDKLRSHLEELVEERAAELRTANEQLEAEIAECKCAQEELSERCAVLKKQEGEHVAELKSANKKLKQAVAERRRAEEELKSARAHLEEVLEEETAEPMKASEQLEREKAGGESGKYGGQPGESEEETPAELKKVSERLEEELAERKRLEGELKVKDSAIALFVDAVGTTNPDGNLTYVNRSFLTMWGCDNEEDVLGEPFSGLWQSEDKAQELMESLREGGGWEGELTAIRKDGSVFEVGLSAGMVKDESDEPMCMVASFVDITGRKQVEEKLRGFEGKFSALSVKSLEWAERLDAVLKEFGEQTTEDAEAVDAEGLEASGVEEAEALDDDAPETVDDETPDTVDAEGLGTAEAEALEAAGTEEREGVRDTESVEADSMDVGLVDIRTEQES